MEISPRAKQILLEHMKEINKKFSSYVDQIRLSIKRKGVTASELSSYLLPQSAYDYDSDNFKLLSEKKVEFECAENVDKVFNLLVYEYCSFLNINIFEDLVKDYKLDEGQEELKYPAYLQKFIKEHTIAEIIYVDSKPVELTNASKEFGVKLNIEHTSTLAKLKDLQHAIARIMKWNISSLRIYDVREGCTEVKFLIPASLATATFTHDGITIPANLKKKFIKLDVLCLECNGLSYNFSGPVAVSTIPLRLRYTLCS